MLTGKEILERGILTGEYINDNCQQQGIDLTLKKLNRVMGDGYVPRIGKAKLPEYIPYENFNNGNVNKITLTPGYYEVIFNEGCKLPANCCAKILGRSSLVRMGVDVKSGLYDAGFETNNMGAFIHVINGEVTLEKGARLAQFVVMESNTVENTYNGTYQNENK